MIHGEGILQLSADEEFRAKFERLPDPRTVRAKFRQSVSKVGIKVNRNLSP